MDENQKLIQQLVGAMIQYQPTGANAVSNVASGAQTQPAAQPTVNPNLFPATPQVAQGMDLGFGSKPPAQSGGAQPTTPTNFPQATPQPAAPSPVVNHFAEAQKFLPNTGANGGVISQLGGQQGNVTPQMPAAPNFVQQLSVPTPQAQAAPVPAAVQTPAAVGTAPTPQSAPQAPADPYAGTLASKSWDKFYRGMTGNSYGDIQAQKQVAANNRENAIQQQADRIKAALGVQRDVGMAQADAIGKGAQAKAQGAKDVAAERARGLIESAKVGAGAKENAAKIAADTSKEIAANKKLPYHQTPEGMREKQAFDEKMAQGKATAADIISRRASLTREHSDLLKNPFGMNEDELKKAVAENRAQFAALDKPAQSAQPAAQTIVNPKTGQRLALKDGKWQPI